MSDIASRVKAIIVDKLGVDENEVATEASFTNDLGADSLDTVELIMEFEKEFRYSNSRRSSRKHWNCWSSSSYIEEAKSKTFMELKRVVVTGLGALTPIGNNIEEYWDGLVTGVSGAAPITYFDAAKFKTRFACELKNFDVNDFIHRKEARKMDKFTQYAMVASDEAIADAGLTLRILIVDRVGVIWGAGIGGLIPFKTK